MAVTTSARHQGPGAVIIHLGEREREREDILAKSKLHLLAGGSGGQIMTLDSPNHHHHPPPTRAPFSRFTVRG